MLRLAYTTHEDPYNGGSNALKLRSFFTDGSVGSVKLSSADILVSDLAIDTAGKIHLLGYTGAVKYFTNKTGPWVQRTISGASAYGNSPASLALDPEGFLHVAFTRCTACDGSVDDPSLVVYATNRSGTWTNKAVMRDTYPIGPTIAYSSGVHLAWGDQTYSNEPVVRYASNVGGSWSFKAWKYSMYLDDYWPLVGVLSIAARAGRPYILMVDSRDQYDPPRDKLIIRSN